MTQLSFPRRPWGHLRTITEHKFRVTRLCFQMGLIRQGLLHDLSKYTPVEFVPGVRYYQGYRSPIDAEKEDRGYSAGWLHHKGHNRHHWEYWLDKKDGRLVCLRIPSRFVAEMVCDRIAACQTYQKEKYTDASALNYYLQGTDRHYLHPETAAQLESYLTWVRDEGIDRAFARIREDLRQRSF